MKKFTITKTYGHEQGLSCVFRQWRAPETHCSKLHGYALSIRLTFASDTLDSRNWVISFGELKAVKAWLADMFDHKTIIAKDDPALGWFMQGEQLGYLQLRVVPAVGCEKFAELIYDNVLRILSDKLTANKVDLVSVEVREHDGNGAVFTPEPVRAPLTRWLDPERMLIGGGSAAQRPDRNYVIQASAVANSKFVSYTTGPLTPKMEPTLQDLVTWIPTKQYVLPLNTPVVGDQK